MPGRIALEGAGAVKFEHHWQEFKADAALGAPWAAGAQGQSLELQPTPDDGVERTHRCRLMNPQELVGVLRLKDPEFRSFSHPGFWEMNSEPSRRV
jgi:hypothetical protein